MKVRVLTGGLFLLVLVLCGVVATTAQERGAGKTDPRVGLKAGLRNAGQAILNLELVASLSKPPGFFDQQAPQGQATAPERPASQEQNAEATAPARPATPAFDPKTANQLSFNNTDFAFRGHQLFMGNYHGFTAYDVEEASKPKLLSAVVCPGGQGDVSVHGNLLFMSVEQVRGRLDCGTEGVQTAVSSERFRGIRIFDISDIKKPRQVGAVQTCRGSHTHTLVPDPADPSHVYLYGSGSSTVRSGEELAGCSNAEAKDDPNTSLFSIDVIEVPIANPERSRIVNKPRLFLDPNTGAINGLWAGGTHGEGTQRTSGTNHCHDITVFPPLGLAAGACSGNGILLDISDPVNPKRLDAVLDKNFAYWHSATFNNDGTKVIFTDEWGGGSRPRCRATDPPTWGADAIFEIADRKLKFAGYFKMPAPQTEQENCVAHNGSLIPVPGRDIMVQAWYQGGLSVFDFTDPAKPVEIAYFDRGPIDAKQLYLGGYWSAYWFNGQIFASEIARGLDVFKLKPSEFLSQNEITAAVLTRAEVFNPQQQQPISFQAGAVTGRAYLDQLARTQGVDAARIGELRQLLDRAERVSPRGQGSADMSRQLDASAAQLESSAASASPIDAKRIRALATLLKTRAAAIR